MPMWVPMSDVTTHDIVWLACMTCFEVWQGPSLWLLCHCRLIVSLLVDAACSLVARTLLRALKIDTHAEVVQPGTWLRAVTQTQRSAALKIASALTTPCL